MISGSRKASTGAAAGIDALIGAAQMPLHCITCRAKIREAILSGRSEEAIQEIMRIDANVRRNVFSVASSFAEVYASVTYERLHIQKQKWVFVPAACSDPEYGRGSHFPSA